MVWIVMRSTRWREEMRDCVAFVGGRSGISRGRSRRIGGLGIKVDKNWPRPLLPLKRPLLSFHLVYHLFCLLERLSPKIIVLRTRIVQPSTLSHFHRIVRQTSFLFISLSIHLLFPSPRIHRVYLLNHCSKWHLYYSRWGIPTMHPSTLSVTTSSATYSRRDGS